MTEGSPTPAPALPAPVRQRVVDLAAERLGVLEPDQVPASLRAIARFTPGRRGRLGAAAIAAAIDTDEDFRLAVVAGLREVVPELAAALTEGRPPPAADPVEVAAAAYLLRAPGWEALAAAAAGEAERRDATAAEAERTAARLREQLEAVRAEARNQADRLRAELAAARSETDDLRRQLREAVGRVRRAEATVAETSRDRDAQREAAASAGAAYEVETRRLRTKLEAAEAAVQEARKAAREGRTADQARLWLLVDTLVRAAQALRQELALAPPDERPADRVAGQVPAGPALGARGHATDDPALLDRLLALPNAHLVVDGYNVTKSGYPTLTLEDQRARLVTGLASLAARTGAEVTCVFDGAALATPAAVPTPRGVRVRFSAAGETADEVIRRIVRAEPPGRPVVVVSADREVADAVQMDGAWALGPPPLLRRLERS